MRGGDLAAMARRILDDNHAPIRDRQHAVEVLHRLRFGLPVGSRDAWLLRCAHGVRRAEVVDLIEHWCGCSG